MVTTVFEEIRIGGAVLRLEHRDVSINAVEPDPDNPRLRLLRKQDGKKGLEEFIKAMPDAAKLRKDIEQNGGLRERVILKPAGKGKYKVVEGNRRFVAIGELHAKYPEDERWQHIAARILPEDVDPKLVAILLADQHVQGKVRWDPHEKAGQIYHMNVVLKIPMDEITVVLHASKSTVQRTLKAYSFMMERFRTVDDGAYEQQGERKWSFFDELHRSKELRKHLDDDPDFADNFCRWVGDERLNRGAQVRDLPKILANQKAREVFERGRNVPPGKAFDDAFKIIETVEPEQGSEFFKLLAKVKENCTSAGTVKEILRIRTDSIARKRVLETYEALRDFMALADVDLPDEASSPRRRNAA